MQLHRLLAVAAAVLLILALPTASFAVDKCKAKVNSRTGALEVSAAPVGANPRWGGDAGAVNVAFADVGTCFVGGMLSKCHLGAPGTLAERTPPEGCVVYVNDGGTPCAALIKGCTPGMRVRDASFTDPNDQRGLSLANLDGLSNLVTELRDDVAALQAASTIQESKIAMAFNGVFHVGANLTNADLSGADLSGMDLSYADLSGANLTGANLTHANLTNADLSGANLSYANLSWADLRNADLTGADLTGANLSTATLTYVRAISLLGCPATLPAIGDWVCKANALLGRRANLSGADLSGADLRWVYLIEVNLSGANLSGADLRYGQCNGDLSSANLTDANLSYRNLDGANLANANLSGTTLTHVRAISLLGCPAALPTDWACRANALLGPYAEAGGANLTGANLSGLNLSGANLSGANLSAADLTGADLTGANLGSVTWWQTTCPDNTRSDGSSPESCCAHLNGKVPAACWP